MKTITLDHWKLMFITACDAIAEKEKYLNELDNLIGDGDHGTSLHRGFEAARSVINTSDMTTVGDLFTKVGSEMLQGIGGAIGPLLGSFFTACARDARDLTEVDLQTWSEMFAAGIAKVRLFGKASPGDKTMIDALQPASEAFAAAVLLNLPLLLAFENAVSAARQGADKTANMVAKYGRAKYLGERGLGHQDPGANSVFFMLNAMTEALTDIDKRNSL
jgi:dihydroxyacetone kinase-like protein